MNLVGQICILSDDDDERPRVRGEGVIKEPVMLSVAKRRRCPGAGWGDLMAWFSKVVINAGSNVVMIQPMCTIEE